MPKRHWETVNGRNVHIRNLMESIVILDKNGRLLRAGQLIRGCFLVGKKKQVIEGHILRVTSYRNITVSLTTKAIQPQKSWVEYRYPGDMFDHPLPGLFTNGDFCCSNGQEWLEIIEECLPI